MRQRPSVGIVRLQPYCDGEHRAQAQRQPHERPADPRPHHGQHVQRFLRLVDCGQRRRHDSDLTAKCKRESGEWKVESGNRPFHFPLSALQLSTFHSPLNTSTAGPVMYTWLSASDQSSSQVAAGQVGETCRPVRPVRHAGHGHGAGAGAARQRDAAAALPGAHRHFVRRLHLHEMDVDAPREDGVRFRAGPDLLQRHLATSSQ